MFRYFVSDYSLWGITWDKILKKDRKYTYPLSLSLSLSLSLIAAIMVLKALVQPPPPCLWKRQWRLVPLCSVHKCHLIPHYPYIVAGTDKLKALKNCHRSHPLKNPSWFPGKVRAGSCLKLFLIDFSLLQWKGFEFSANNKTFYGGSCSACGRYYFVKAHWSEMIDSNNEFWTRGLLISHHYCSFLNIVQRGK